MWAQMPSLTPSRVVISITNRNLDKRLRIFYESDFILLKLFQIAVHYYIFFLPNLAQ
jgi:hypothetical protein